MKLLKIRLRVITVAKNLAKMCNDYFKTCYTIDNDKEGEAWCLNYIVTA